jgi:hypothetical protein
MKKSSCALFHLSCTWAGHLIPGLIFFRETIIRSKVATEWDTWKLCASVCAKPEVGISPHSLCGSLSVYIYLQRASHLTMEEKVQQPLCIDFCLRLGKTGAETYEKLQAALGESCLSRSKIFEWYSRFKSGRQSFEDDPHSGRPYTSHTEETVTRAREIIHADRRLSVPELNDQSTYEQKIWQDTQSQRNHFSLSTIVYEFF